MIHHITTSDAFRDDTPVAPREAVTAVTDHDGAQFLVHNTGDIAHYCSHWCVREALADDHDMPEADPFGSVVVHRYVKGTTHDGLPWEHAVILTWGPTFDTPEPDDRCANCHDHM